MRMTGTLEKAGADYFVARSEPDFFRPIMRTLRWRVTGAYPAAGNYGPAPQLETSIGSEVTYENEWSLYRHGAWTIIQTEGNGSASYEPIPCPRVRANVPTRYESGRWQKYTKSHGWISA